MRFLLTRPREDSEKLARNLTRLGHSSLIDPLITIEPCGPGKINLSLYEAVLLTSANGARALARTTDKRDIPLFAVGEATANAARAAGFTTIQTAGGDVHTLTQLVSHSLSPQSGPLLHVAGKTIAGDLQGQLKKWHFQVDRIVLYTARPADSFSTATIDELHKGSLNSIVFYSPRTARIFKKLITQYDLGHRLATISALCLSHAVVEQLKPLTFKDVITADNPTTQALFAPLGIDMS
ncbi:MAG: uroporphyrinogen-III synthase [Kordiimonas sp.]|nr:uroporphyrinogen-III synthase [Kordiimonas sp.]|tara:strand:+ start:1996 stop:2709 length:714 start_codon:yes stop_codon:yes gene_type:complete